MSHHYRALVVYGASTIDEAIYLLGRKRRCLPVVRLRCGYHIDVGQQQVWHKVRL